MNRKVAIISALIVICAMAILLLGCSPPLVRVRPPEPRVEYYGSPPPIQMPFGDPGTGNIGEGIRFGFQAIGRDVQRPMPIGSLAIGNQEEEVGSGSVVVGSTDNRI